MANDHSEDYQKLWLQLNESEKNKLLEFLRALKSLRRRSPFPKAWHWALNASEFRLNAPSDARNNDPDPKHSPIANRDVPLMAKAIYDDHFAISPEAADRFIEDFMRSIGVE